MAIAKTNGVFVKEGATIDITPAAEIKCGAFKVVCGCLCMALWDLPADKLGTLKILHKGEVVRVTTDDALGATTAGTALYIDGNGLVTKTATSNTLLGYAAAAIGATDLSFEVVCA